MAYSEFKKIGRLGCGECYHAFKKYLAPLLRRIHGSSQHTGKSPLKVTKIFKKKADLQELRMRLQQAVVEENFEEAARLRDQIRELEKREHDEAK
jgi:protein arginine kinase activator